MPHASCLNIREAHTHNNRKDTLEADCAAFSRNQMKGRRWKDEKFVGREVSGSGLAGRKNSEKTDKHILMLMVMTAGEDGEDCEDWRYERALTSSRESRASSAGLNLQPTQRDAMHLDLRDASRDARATKKYSDYDSDSYT